MMVLRDCVRRHGRAPQWIVSDGGPDFRSVYYETLLGRLHCNKKSRRTSKSRDGSIIERFFRTTKEQFILTLLGSTKIYEHYRQVSPEVDPERHAIWTMERFAVRFEAYIESVYHENEHSTLRDAIPDQMFALGLVSYGQRRHILVSYNRDFIALTCPSTAKGAAKVGPRGVKINYLYYSCPSSSCRASKVPPWRSFSTLQHGPRLRLCQRRLARVSLRVLRGLFAVQRTGHSNCVTAASPEDASAQARRWS